MMSRMALQVENTNDLAFGSKRWIFKRVLTTDSTLVERLPRTSRFLVISSSCCSGTLLNTNYIKYHCWFTVLRRQRLIKGVNRKNWYKILACIVKSIKYPTYIRKKSYLRPANTSVVSASTGLPYKMKHEC